jgi:hypothetical protein
MTLSNALRIRVGASPFALRRGVDRCLAAAAAARRMDVVATISRPAAAPARRRRVDC